MRSVYEKKSYLYIKASFARYKSKKEMDTMQTIEREYTIKAINEGIENKTIGFDHPMQRKPGQWNHEQQSLLIHSILANFAIPQAYALQQFDGDYDSFSVLDGKQRFTTLYSYMKDGFKLSDDTPVVNLQKRKVVTDENGQRRQETTIEEYEIAGKYFSELDTKLKDKLKDKVLSVIVLVDCTDEEIEDQFYRLNNGTALTKDQKTRVLLGDELAAFVDKIETSDFFAEDTHKSYFTALSRKRGEIQTCILQTLMLEGYNQDLDDAESALKEFEETYNSLIGDKDSNSSKQFNFYEEYEDYLDNIKDKFGEDISKAIEDVSSVYENGPNTYGVAIHFDELEIDETAKSKITESYNTFVQDYKTSVDVAKSELESKNNEMSNMMMTWVEDINLYKNGGDTFQKAIQSMVGSIDWAQVDVEEGNLDDAKRVIQETVLAPLNAACDDPDKKLQITNALNKLFTVDFSQMSFQDANKMIEGFLTTIMNALNEGVLDDQKKSMPDMYEMFGLGNYSDTADKMKNSLASIAEEGSADYNKLASYTSKFNQSQVESWLSATKGANGATDAINKYEQSIKSASETEAAPISFFEAWENYHCCYCIRLENIFVGYCEWIYLYVSGIVVVTKQRSWYNGNEKPMRKDSRRTAPQGKS